MKLKKEIFIKGNLWKVEQKWNLTFRNKRVEGLCDPTSKIIFVDRSLTPDDKFLAFRHEWRHAVLHEYELGYESGRLSMKLEEEIQDALDTEEPLTFTIKAKK